MDHLPKISIIVSTYNWPEALNLVLIALNNQSYQKFEVLVADDGSTQDTRQLVERHQIDYKQPLHHIWHVDLGFRLSAIRNRAIKSCDGQYLIFLDGDCIPRSNFIEAHAYLAKQGKFVTGNRILLSKEFTQTVLRKQIHIHQNSLIQWVKHRLYGDINRLLPLLTLSLKWWRDRNQSEWRRAIGCNIAAWKTDLLHTNGFDEDFVGWGYEDSDLVMRLINTGVYRREGRYATGVIHLWHPETEKNAANSNLQQLMNTQNSQKTIAKNGIEQLS